MGVKVREARKRAEALIRYHASCDPQLGECVRAIAVANDSLALAAELEQRDEALRKIIAVKIPPEPAWNTERNGEPRRIALHALAAARVVSGADDLSHTRKEEQT